MTNIKYLDLISETGTLQLRPMGEKMIKSDKTAVLPGSEEHLPSRQTFLLRFSDATQPEAGIYRGKVEHLGTGKTARFTSFSEVIEFTNAVMESDVGETNETS